MCIYTHTYVYTHTHLFLTENLEYINNEKVTYNFTLFQRTVMNTWLLFFPLIVCVMGCLLWARH